MATKLTRRYLNIIANHKFQGEFVDDGTETHFEVGKNVCYIKSKSSGKRNVGLIHQLYVNGQIVEDTVST